MLKNLLPLEASVNTLYEHLREGSQTPLEIRSEMGFNKGTSPTRRGNQLNGNPAEELIIMNY